MYWLIEGTEQIKFLQEQKYEEVFVEIVSFNNNIHPSLNNISLIYFHPINESKGYMLCLEHNDTLSLELEEINLLFEDIKKIWVRDKKNTLYYFPLKTLNDINTIEEITPEISNVYSYYYTKYGDIKTINKIIPIVKHYEYCHNIYNKIVTIINKPLPPYYDFYNNKVCIAFFGIEKNGIKINENQFTEKFPNIEKLYSIKNSRIYTQYNLGTTTKRPSNSFNGLNFASLKKDNHEREVFIPENDKFLEIDCSAYHPSLCAKLIKYKFDKPIYEEFAYQTGISVDKAKEAFFGVIYGGKFDSSLNTEFFIKIKEYILNDWKNFNNEGKIIVPISNYELQKDKLEDMNPYKLFNYLLQNLESSLNTLIILDILRILRGKHTKLVLYCYDSFLFDFDNNEISTIIEINQVFEKYDLKIKTKEGLNYDFN